MDEEKLRAIAKKYGMDRHQLNSFLLPVNFTKQIEQLQNALLFEKQEQERRLYWVFKYRINRKKEAE
jgi:hypothetical protein